MVRTKTVKSNSKSYLESFSSKKKYEQIALIKAVEFKIGQIKVKFLVLIATINDSCVIVVNKPLNQYVGMDIE